MSWGLLDVLGCADCLEVCWMSSGVLNILKCSECLEVCWMSQGMLIVLRCAKCLEVCWMSWGVLIVLRAHFWVLSMTSMSRSYENEGWLSTLWAEPCSHNVHAAGWWISVPLCIADQLPARSQRVLFTDWLIFSAIRLVDDDRCNCQAPVAQNSQAQPFFPTLTGKICQLSLIWTCVYLNITLGSCRAWMNDLLVYRTLLFIACSVFTEDSL